MSNSSVDYQSGLTAGTNAERKRIHSILTCSAADGQTQLAMCLAFDQVESSDAAQGILSAATTRSANAKRIRERAAATYGISEPHVR